MDRAPGVLSRRDLLGGALVSALASAVVGCARCNSAAERAMPAQLTHETRAIVRSMAERFGLRHDELERFDLGWEIFQRITNLHGDPHRRELLVALQAESRAELDAAMTRLAAAVAGTPSSAPGARAVRREPVAGRRYVVFSDHHYAYAGHRTSFFTEKMNLGVYVQALERYFDAGFALVENGDVEELVIFDPTYSPDEVRLRHAMTLQELQARRRVLRLAQLRRILADPANEPLFRATARFDAERRLIRVAGNHDYDLQRDEFLAELHRIYPNLEAPSDILLLDREAADGGQPTTLFAVLHGHQFDEATNPVSAPRIGETVSECLGLYFQGPDRTWRWELDPVASWLAGELPLANNLVSGAVDLTAVSASDLAATFAETRRHTSLADTFDELGDRFLEALMKHRIAFDYFLHRDPARAVRDEVMTGERFFKYRLLDEQRIVRELVRAFPDPARRPTLLLGHTHEARLSPWSLEDRAPFAQYLNASSAGRFENLVWGIEIVDGVSELVSWSRNPALSGAIERRTWKTQTEPGGGLLRADPGASPLPRPVIESGAASSGAPAPPSAPPPSAPSPPRP